MTEKRLLALIALLIGLVGGLLILNEAVRGFRGVSDLAAILSALVPLVLGIAIPRTRGTSADKIDRKSTRLNSSHITISYAVFCLKKKKNVHSDDGILRHAKVIRPQRL